MPGLNDHPKTTLKLGTRKSLLAMAQSQWVARQIEKHNPGLKVELVGIVTQGDVQTDKPLYQMEGQNFFVAELDKALLERRVDLSVHSMKDLSLERPPEIRLAAVPNRENPRDVIIWSPRCDERIASGHALRVGTSAPRRLQNLPEFLEKALPVRDGKSATFEWKEIRGNVNTRLSRVTSSDPEQQIDGVVLALAGLNRLWMDEQARLEMQELMQGLRLMVLPLTQNPTSPAQGALAIECHAEDQATFEAIRKIHHPVTEQQVTQERKILKSWGGGCHLKLGASAVITPGDHSLLIIKGCKPDGELIDETQWSVNNLLTPQRPVRAWDSSEQSFEYGECLIDTSGITGPLFIAHARALPSQNLVDPKNSRIWTSGSPSWFQLAQRGFWVEGCAENWGIDTFKQMIASPFLELPQMADWTILTHTGAESTWPEGRVLGTYKIEGPSEPQESEIQAIRNANVMFWSSSSKFKFFGKYASPETIHCCGPGKTWQALKRDGVKNLQVFPSRKEWKKWISLLED